MGRALTILAEYESKLRSRHVIIEFKDYATALACYRSPEYAVAKEKRKGKGDSGHGASIV